jgi:PAS domain-containing protein
MAAPDFRQLFEAAPGLLSVLDREFRTVAVSDAYLRATMTRREDLVGRPVFEAFPSGPQDPEGKAQAAIRSVLERALRDGTPQMLALQRYDVRRPA